MAKNKNKQTTSEKQGSQSCKDMNNESKSETKSETKNVYTK